LSYQNTPIRQWPQEDRPREKLFRRGVHTLTDSELLSILLRTGIHGQSALDLSRTILKRFRSFRHMGHSDISRWISIKGVGRAKIAQVMAAIEIGRRFGEEKLKTEGLRIESSKDIADVFMPRMRDLKREIVQIVLLNSQNSVIEIVEVEEGTVNAASPLIREIFAKAIQYFAVSLICVHNHPSGDITPSPEDKMFTKKISLGAEALQMVFLDHIIIGDDKYYSFADEGFI